MKAFIGVSLIGAFLGSLALAQNPSISKPFSKGECVVTYENADKTYSFKTIKKEKAAELHQKLPQASESLTCNEEIKADMKLESQNCQVFCNPN